CGEPKAAGCVICLLMEVRDPRPQHPPRCNRVLPSTESREAPRSGCAGPLFFFGGAQRTPGLRKPNAADASYPIKQGSARGHGLRYTMSPNIEECVEHARQCEWYAVRTSSEADRKFLLRKARDWRKLAIRKEPEIRAAAKTAA